MYKTYCSFNWVELKITNLPVLQVHVFSMKKKLLLRLNDFFWNNFFLEERKLKVELPQNKLRKEANASFFCCKTIFVLQLFFQKIDQIFVNNLCAVTENKHKHTAKNEKKSRFFS